MRFLSLFAVSYRFSRLCVSRFLLQLEVSVFQLCAYFGSILERDCGLFYKVFPFYFQG